MGSPLRRGLRGTWVSLVRRGLRGTWVPL